MIIHKHNNNNNNNNNKRNLMKQHGELCEN